MKATSSIIHPKLTLALLICGFANTQAATLVWDGATNKDWGNPGNWSTGSVPSATDDALFDGTASQFTVDLGGSDRTIGDLSINSASIYRFQDGSGDESLTLDNVTITNGSGHYILHDVVLADTTSTWNFASGTYMYVSGVISGNSSLIKEGDGLLTLNNTMTYTGGTTINDGMLAVAPNAFNALANSAVTVNGGGNLTIDANGNGNTFNVGSLAGSGSTEIDGGNVHFGGNNTNTTYSGTLQDSLGGGSVSKTGTGT